ncbi:MULTISPECIES: aromatic/alkene monooxygenase hydroxylase subunit beta [Marinobacter]|uniref:aromatic/alkene monooxygenase hydroxylase subunit beta n=1 Tax=Marinobacter TaxID=2742 RepID=UPI0012452E85|nr:MULTISPECIES: aromatic/alkene monooxygenase hydroxylase subunit beta [Marinobacter]MBL3556355.1 aromatic/alkene monooxygenase hydroxylase subunit beta [Marinobacter sp. JB05H06]
MQIDVRTVSIEPVRKTFDHLARRFGNKPASRYQEGSYDIQAAENLHYRPTWDPDQELYDPNLSRIRMKDWYDLKDPRQFYYSTYTLARARQQENVEANFAFVEARGLQDMLPEDIVEKSLKLLVPLRHAAWGANQNNTLACGYGYGVVFTQPCMYHAMDNLGISQYLSRIGLLLGGVEALEQAKDAWLNDSAWQALRRLVEDTMAIRDPFEVFVAQNVVLDGLLYPVVYERLVDTYLASQGGQAVAMLTQFMTNWFTESKKWTNGVLKVTAAESDENAKVLAEWINHWSDRAVSAILPIVNSVLDERVDEMVSEELEAFRARIAKTGIQL